MRLLALTIASVLLAGCENGWLFDRKSQPETPPQESPEVVTTPEEGGRQAVAIVNGRPIHMADLQDLLLRSHGPSKAWVLITAELARQHAEAQGLTVTEDDLREQEDRMLEQAFGFLPDSSQRQRRLELELGRLNISHKEWRIILHRNTILRKLAEREATVSDAELKTVFGDMYGPKVRVRHIQTASLGKAQEVLEKLKAGANFAEMAMQYSVNPTARTGGMLPPITPHSPTVPPFLRAAALKMKAVGEISKPIQDGTQFHILYLAERVPAKDVRLEDVKQQVLAAAKSRKIQSVRDELIRKLVDGAKIRYLHPILKPGAGEGTRP